MSNLLSACGDNGHVAPDAPPGPTIISITSDQAPALVAFRDGIGAPWQPATMKTRTTFEAEVYGPYVVTVVCEGLPGRSRTLQVGRTPDDANRLTLSCDLMHPSEHAVTGHMVQAGHVQLGASSAADTSSTAGTAGWDFQLLAANGAYDLIAATTDRIAVRRAVVVDGETAVTPPIDVAIEGKALADVTFTAKNAAQDALAVSVDLLTRTTPLPAYIYAGALATAKAAPDSALSATDTQRVTVQETRGALRRSLQRPFRVGDSTELTFALPIAFGAQWTIEGGQLSTRWAALPQLDSLEISSTSFAADGTELASHHLDMTPLFLAETGIANIAIDTDIPGYQPGWKIDLQGSYTRDLTASRTVNEELATSSFTETVHAP